MYSWWSLASTGGAYICFQKIILYRCNSVNGHNLNITYMSSFCTTYCGHTSYVLHVGVPSNTRGTSGCGIIPMLPTNVDIESASTGMFVVVPSETLSWALICWHIDCSMKVSFSGNCAMRVAWNVSLAVKQRVWFQYHEDSARDAANIQQWLNTTYLTVTRMCPLFDHVIICISDIDMYLKNSWHTMYLTFLKQGTTFMETLCAISFHSVHT